mgnify:FL=1
MLKFIVKRLLAAIPTLLLALTLIFFLMRALPGDPLYALLGNNDLATEDDVARMAEQMELDGSYLDQYLRYMSNIFTGDWGDSYFMGVSVFEAIMSRIEPTLMLTWMSLLINIGIGVPLGILGATHKNTLVDYSASTFSIVFMCIPNFCLGILLIYVFGYLIPIFPMSNYMKIAQNGFWKACYSLILPAFSIGMTNVASTARYTRAQMISVLSRDYIRTARAKGLSLRNVYYKHALKNAFGTILTIISGSTLNCLGGSVVVETVFNINGIGALFSTALSRQDYPLVQADVVVMTVLFIFINILVDIGYKLLDPRVELN